MKLNVIKLGFLVAMAVASNIQAQRLAPSDTSERSVKRYRNTIESNKEIVNFIEYTFVKKGLPRHLKNLALIESGFDSSQTSSAGAKGMWQFMVGHANDYGLTEEHRSDIYRSTQTAARSLADLYRKYNNWVTVIAAYNCGEGNVSKAMRRAGSTRYTNFAQYLPDETINHVQKYLNACYASGELNSVLDDYDRSAVNSRLNFSAPKKGAAKGDNLAETQLNSAYDLEVIAKYLKIEMNDLLAWNSELKGELEKTGETPFFLPDDLMVTFKVNQNKILSDSLKK